MSTNDTQVPAAAPQGEPTGMGQQMRDLGSDAALSPGTDALERAAVGGDIGPQDADLLRGYFFGNAPKPGSQTTKAVKVKFPENAGEFPTTVRSVTYGEWKDAQERGTNDDTGEQNPYVTASYIVARAMVKPDLGALFSQVRAKRIADQQDPPADTAAVLRDFFGAVPGALLGLSSRVVGLSGLSMSAELVVEVEAGKD